MPDWKRTREQTKALAGNEPPEWGWLQFLDAQMSNEKRADATGEPPTTRWWRDTLLAFWRSGAPFLAAGVGIRGTKSTTAVKVAIVETILRPRVAVLDQVAVFGIMSANTAEANQRCDTIAKILRGVGLREVDKEAAVGPDTYNASVHPTTGRSFFTALDADGNKVRWMISPPTLAAASGWTGCGFFADELALWQDASGNNPADKVLELAHGRLHGQPGAHGYHISVKMGPLDPLTVMIGEAEKSGTEGLFVARVGERGAARDKAARDGLRLHLQSRALHAETTAQRAAASRYADDPRLAADPDPMSTSVPTWVARDGEPVSEILECFRLASVKMRKGDEGGSIMDVLFSRYGSRPSGDGTHKLFSPAILAAARATSPVW